MRKENGVWHIEENLFWNYIWGFNSLYFIKILSEIPLALIVAEGFFTCKKTEFISETKSVCLLFWGSLFGIILTPIAFVIGAFCFLMLSFTIFIIFSIPAFFGFYPNFVPGEGENLCYPYKHWKTKRIHVAAWEVCAVLLALYLIATSSVYTIVTVIVVLCVIIAIIVAISLLSDTFKAIWERVKRLHRWLCPLVIIEPKRQK